MNTENEKKSFGNIKTLLIGASVFTVISIVLRTLSLLFFYDKEIGYYKLGAVLPAISNIFIVLALMLIAAGSFFLTNNSELTREKDKGIAIKISSALCVLASAFFVIISVYLMTSLTVAPSLKIFIFFAASFFSAVYFLANLLPMKAELQAISSVAIVIFLVYTLGASYFDAFLQMNSPNKIFLHLACIATMCFFLSEARALLGKTRKKLYLFFLCASTLIGGSTSIPTIIAYHSGALLNYDYILSDYAILALWIYIAVRLVLCFLPRKIEIIEESEPQGANIEKEINDNNEISEEETEEKLSSLFEDNTPQNNE